MNANEKTKPIVTVAGLYTVFRVGIEKLGILMSKIIRGRGRSRNCRMCPGHCLRNGRRRTPVLLPFLADQQAKNVRREPQHADLFWNIVLNGRVPGASCWKQIAFREARSVVSPEFIAQLRLYQGGAPAARMKSGGKSVADGCRWSVAVQCKTEYVRARFDPSAANRVVFLVKSGG